MTATGDFREFPWRIAHGSLTLNVRLTPKAADERIEGMRILADDRAFLCVRVRAVAEKNKANKALVALLAKYLNCPKSAISIVSGHTARNKLLEIKSTPKALVKTLQAAIAPRR